MLLSLCSYSCLSRTNIGSPAWRAALAEATMAVGQHAIRAGESISVQKWKSTWRESPVYRCFYRHQMTTGDLQLCSLLLSENSARDGDWRAIENQCLWPAVLEETIFVIYTHTHTHTMSSTVYNNLLTDIYVTLLECSAFNTNYWLLVFNFRKIR